MPSVVIKYNHLQQTVTSAVSPWLKFNIRPQRLVAMVARPKAAGLVMAALAALIADGIYVKKFINLILQMIESDC